MDLMSGRNKGVSALVVAVSMMLILTGCFPFSEGSEPPQTTAGAEVEPAAKDQVGDAVEATSLSLQNVETRPATSGLTHGWWLYAERAVPDSLTADQLRELLTAAWANSGTEPDFLQLVLVVDKGDALQMVDVAAAADELGLEHSIQKQFVNFSGFALSRVLGAWGT